MKTAPEIRDLLQCLNVRQLRSWCLSLLSSGQCVNTFARAKAIRTHSHSARSSLSKMERQSKGERQ